MTSAPVMHRSYSQVNTLRTCGEQYRLTKIEHAPERPSCAAVAGSAVHLGTEIVDQMIHSGETSHGDLLYNGLQACESYVADRILEADIPVDQWKTYGYRPRQDLEWWARDGLPNSIKAYIDWRLSTPDFKLAIIDGKPAIEVSFDINLGDVRIKGRIDRVFQQESTGQVFAPDIKSGNKPKTDEQLGLYRAALGVIGVDVTYGVYIYGLKRGKAELTPPLDLRHWTAEKLYEVYGAAEQQIRNSIFVPHPGEACFHCSVSDHCQFYRAAI